MDKDQQIKIADSMAALAKECDARADNTKDKLSKWYLRGQAIGLMKGAIKCLKEQPLNQ